MPTSTTRTLIGLAATGLTAATLLLATASASSAQPRQPQPQRQAQATTPANRLQAQPGGLGNVRPVVPSPPGVPIAGVPVAPPAPLPPPWAVVPPPPALPAPGISYTYNVTVVPCTVWFGTCTNASATGTVTAVGAPTPANTELRTSLYAVMPTGNVPLAPFGVIPSASTVLPQAVPTSTATVIWASPAIPLSQPLPAGSSDVCLSAQFFVNGVGKGAPLYPGAHKIVCTKAGQILPAVQKPWWQLW